MDEGALGELAATPVQRGRRLPAGQARAGGSGGLGWVHCGIVATARLRLRSLPGLLRPGLAVVLPTGPKPTLLVDADAIADPKPEMLVQFAQLGVAYAQVGLRRGGSAGGPAHDRRRAGARETSSPAAAHELLAAPPHGGLPIRFTGNIEGSDLLTGKVDVVVTDGFTGNVALKTIEGAAAFATELMRAALQGSATARFGTLFQRRGAARAGRADGRGDLRRGRAARPGGHRRHRPRGSRPRGSPRPA